MVSLIKKYFSYGICTVFGAGYFPFAPGTVTSILTVLLIYFLQADFIILTILTAATLFSGIILSAEIEKYDGTDPRHVVIDEVCGQVLTFIGIAQTSWLIFLAGLVLFRFFDILKPLGINKLQTLRAGWGIMLDDVLAGIYSNLVLHILIIAGIFI